MSSRETQPTKILIIDQDEAAFQIRQCVAKALTGDSRVELFHARDATEALAMIERVQPDVIVIDDEEVGEKDLLLDSLSLNHPPVVVESEGEEDKDEPPVKLAVDQEVTKIPKSDGVDSIHRNLTLVAEIGTRFTHSRGPLLLH